MSIDGLTRVFDPAAEIRKLKAMFADLKRDTAARLADLEERMSQLPMIEPAPPPEPDPIEAMTRAWWSARASDWDQLSLTEKSQSCFAMRAALAAFEPTPAMVEAGANYVKSLGKQVSYEELAGGLFDVMRTMINTKIKTRT